MSSISQVSFSQKDLSMMSTASMAVPDGKRAKTLIRQIYAMKKVERPDVEWLLQQVKPIFMSQPMLIEVTAPISICGDTHGQLADVVRLFNQNGWPPKMRYLFLGKFLEIKESDLNSSSNFQAIMLTEDRKTLRRRA